MISKRARQTSFADALFYFMDIGWLLFKLFESHYSLLDFGYAVFLLQVSPTSEYSTYNDC